MSDKKYWLTTNGNCVCSNRMYVLYDYDKVKKVNIRQKFEHIKTWDNLEANIEFLKTKLRISPTGCYFKLNKTFRTFYHDQQDCAIWALTNDDRVWSLYDMTIVSDSLPDFLSRTEYDKELYFRNGKQTEEDQEYLASLDCEYCHGVFSSDSDSDSDSDSSESE